MICPRRLDVHHRLAPGRHNQDTQADWCGFQHRGPGAAEQPAVRSKDLQRTRTARGLLAPVLGHVRLRWLSEAVFRGAVQKVDRFVIAGSVRLSVRWEDRLGRQDMRGRPERGATGDGLPEHVGLYVQQHAVHTQSVGMRWRRRLSRQLRRGTKLHQ